MELKTVTEAIQYQEDRFTKKILFKQGDSVAFVLNFMPGQQLPVHKHPGSDVYLLALKGSGTVYVDEVEHIFAEGDVLYIGGEESFAYLNSGSLPASLHVVIAKVPGPAYTQEI
ncbi:cupin domain-containing protein [Paenibacillus sp. PK3_47]|uniref:cupin domain-containing protein n=1 Tax=Paenibacillus sp. PK3_47 TaxID=2072642 RepID=UPI00201D8934|nr:cupin domain-containing protein [Paenibacillus sp. PK3_47]UQZ33724.1 cupin domain-containing protein [Paenibacillus sp. PK3_47]